MLNQLMRYLPLASLVGREGSARILEVGGGLNGLNKYLPEETIIAVDISFKDIDSISTEKFFPIRGSALHLPFDDNSFSVVVCSDALEHIPNDDRCAVITELCRVSSGKVFLSFPVAETYGKWEQLLLKAYGLLEIKTPEWLKDHVAKGLPEEAAVIRFLKKNRMRFEVIPNENNLIHFFIMIADASRFSRYLNYVSDIVSPATWDKKKHSCKANLLRSMLVPLRKLPGVLSFGSTVRKIFIIDKGNPDRKNIADYYDSNPRMICSPFGGLGQSPTEEHAYLTKTLAALQVDLYGKKVLDVGCGAGWLASYSKGKVKAYAGVDISMTSVEAAKKITQDVRQADSQNLPFLKDSFDYLFCIDSFEHVPDQEASAKEFYRVLAGDGKVFLSVPNYSNVAGVVKKIEEVMGFYEKDTWAPFDNWSYQALEQFVTPGRIRSIFMKAGFTKFSVIGGKQDLIDGIFPWINHRRMPCKARVRNMFSHIQKPFERFYYLSLHNFWLIAK
jgi:2-polyprenyl-6-hydroxyphenyl methylase/3-demethylubiquinone-9 3-methyltransferase